MLMNKCINKKLIAVMSLLAMMLFVIVSNIHMHNYLTDSDAISHFTSNTISHTSQISLFHDTNHNAGCPACEILHLGLGNSNIAPTVQIETTTLCESIPKSPLITIKTFLSNEQPTRAPPA